MLYNLWRADNAHTNHIWWITILDSILIKNKNFCLEREVVRMHPRGTCFNSYFPTTPRHQGSFSHSVHLEALRSGTYYQTGNPLSVFKVSLKFIMILLIIISKEIIYLKKFLYSIVSGYNTYLQPGRKSLEWQPPKFSPNTLWFLGEMFSF